LEDADEAGEGMTVVSGESSDGVMEDSAEGRHENGMLCA
jgi:hypothetical protein